MCSSAVFGNTNVQPYYLVNLSDVSGSSRRLREIAGISIYISPLYILQHYPCGMEESEK